ncbi:MAG: branched-chain amino acid ABC transporter permease [Chloroflexi bacterium]|nr:branched-chain amino acid ABC transporter permease [Chloroflexota bacterium]
MIILVIALALVIALQYLVMRTRIGQQMRAVAFNQRTAALLGINVGRVYVLTFFLAGLLGGAAGLLYGLVFLNVTPFIGDDVALVGLTAIVLGGLGSINGALVGGFLVAAIQTFSIAIGGSNYKNAVVFGLLFVLLLARPQGLFGQSESTRA